jgi:hypothetical protein
MNAATLQAKDNAIAPRLYMAMELSNKTWKLVFGDGVKRRRVRSCFKTLMFVHTPESSVTYKTSISLFFWSFLESPLASGTGQLVVYGIFKTASYNNLYHRIQVFPGVPDNLSGAGVAMTTP